MDTQLASAPVEVEEAEAALVENYPRLVRLAYLTLPPTLGRHRRVLTAHTLVQRALPRGRRGPGPAYAFVRLQVLRAALTHEERTGWRRSLHGAATAARPPYVLGLRLHPEADGTEDRALDRALGGLDEEARAAYVLLVLERLPEREVRHLLAEVGAADPREAVVEAASVGAPQAGAVYDPCTVQARPTDLLRRRQHGRAALAAVVAVTASVALLGLPGGDAPRYGAGGSPASSAPSAALLDPAEPAVADAKAWTGASRRDFTAWPARGGRTGDTSLLRRALEVWARPGAEVTVSATPGTSRGVPAQPPRLLYAGDVDAATVVLLYDGMRIVRYAEPLDGKGPAALDFARVDGADAATGSASAVVISRTDGNARFLTAPWITTIRTRDLLKPTVAGVNLVVSAEGVTDPVPMPAPDSRCAAWPALELTGPAPVAAQTALLTDLGDPTPVRLTFGLKDVAGTRALASWSRTACYLGSMRGSGVRTVNNWEYARQRLPGAGGAASWVCTRGETWRGEGSRALVLFMAPPAASGSGPTPGISAGQVRGTAACGPYDLKVLAGVLWKSNADQWYLLAAGSRGVARIASAGDVTASARGNVLAAPAQQGARPELSGALRTGEAIKPLGG